MTKDLLGLSLGLLGSFQCILGGTETSLNFRTKKERALLAYLAVESGRIHQRDMLGEVFWPGKPDGYARMNLRQALSGIRREIQEYEGESPFLLISDDHVRFNPQSNTEIDCQVFDRIFDATLSHKHQSVDTCPTCVENLVNLVVLYRGDFLEELHLANSQTYQEWVLFQREHYFRRLLTSIHTLIKHYQETNQIKLALDYAYRQANLASLEESAHRQLMMLLALDGRRSAALEQYQICCQILSDELDVTPDLETTALYEKIRAGMIFNATHPITKSKNTNLPVQFTKFVGRVKELDQAFTVLQDPANRLFTIAGISGVGKTRFAIQLGAKLMNDFSDGVWFVPLNSIGNLDLIPHEIARVFGINLGEADARRFVINALRPKEALLIIDNFEHLLDGTEFLLDILRGAPGIKIVVTSQRRLAYQAAHILELKGLPFPEEGAKYWREFEAVELFMVRAKQNQPDFQIGNPDIPHLIRICQFVAGLPLGLELAAAGLKYFSCERIAQELRHNLDILRTTMIDVPARHRSIRAAFEQSWIMLSDVEQDAYRRLSVFQGEFSIDEAIATTGASLGIISALVDRSLVQKNTTGYYSIQPILRQFAAEKLEDIYDISHGDLPFYGNQIASITRDPLTNLPNKVLFRDLFKHSLAVAQRRSHLLELFIVAVDDFNALKRKLDGDEINSILKAVANSLTRSVRKSDIVAYLVPGKFAIILENISEIRDGGLVSEKIHADLNKSQIACSDGSKITLRVGISIYPMDSDSLVELLQYANIALNQAKLTNDGYRFYSYEKQLFFSTEV